MEELPTVRVRPAIQHSNDPFQLTDADKQAIQQWYFETWAYMDKLSDDDKALLADWLEGIFAVKSDMGMGMQMYTTQRIVHLLRLQQIVCEAPPVPVDMVVYRGLQLRGGPLKPGDTVSFLKPCSSSLSCPKRSGKSSTCLAFLKPRLAS